MNTSSSRFPILTHSFNELSPKELHDIFQLRNACFVVEQKAIYQELDGNDLTATHCRYVHHGQLLGYLRFMAVAGLPTTIKLSRLCVTKNHRDKNIGRRLVQHVLNLNKTLNTHTVQLTAQKYLLDYYQSFGFETSSPTYLVNQIEHIDMEKRLNRDST